MKKIFTVILASLILFPMISSASALYSGETSELTDKKPAKKKKGEIKEVVFKVFLHCEDCVEKVTENIAFEKGVKDLDVSMDTHTVTIKYDAVKTSEATLQAAVAKLGYPMGDAATAAIEQALGHTHEHGHDHGHDHGHEHK